MSTPINTLAALLADHTPEELQAALQVAQTQTMAAAETAKPIPEPTVQTGDVAAFTVFFRDGGGGRDYATALIELERALNADPENWPRVNRALWTLAKTVRNATPHIQELILQEVEG